jgi:hypothetical protein
MLGMLHMEDNLGPFAYHLANVARSLANRLLSSAFEYRDRKIELEPSSTSSSQCRESRLEGHPQ